MATLEELARQHTALDASALGHLKRLVGSWGMLADLSFADLLLFAPVSPGDEAHTDAFVVLGQVRPVTTQTLHRDDLLGRLVDGAERAVAARALRLGEIVEGEFAAEGVGERARAQCIPIRWRGEVIAVLSRESLPTVGRRAGELERAYTETFERFARMIARGEFPFGGEDAVDPEDSPRVSDGMVLLDDHSRITFASPNAVSAFHRLGINTNVEGLRFDELDIEESAVRAAYATLFPVAEEVERSDVNIALRCIPLIDEGKVTGAVVLVRDVTQLRRLDRLLVSKDAALREVHHRVKNNLQTIQSLLRLQARRLGSPEARSALEEAERRIWAIARVHEILSREAVDQVPFDEIIEDLVRVSADTAASLERSVAFAVDGDAGELPAHVATPLAVALHEILLNAVEHGFDAVDDAGLVRPEGRIDVRLDNDGETLAVEVRDNGRGLPAGFSIAGSERLGLSIVARFVESQLGGSIELGPAAEGPGTVARLRVPLDPEGSTT